MKHTKNISLLFLFSIISSFTSMQLEQRDVNHLENFLKDLALNTISKAINPIVALYFENLLKEFNVDPTKTFPQRVDLNNYKIPQNLQKRPESIKNPGMFLAITTDTINKNIQNLMPRFLKVMKETQIPFIYQIGPILIESFKMTIPQGQDPRSIQLYADPVNNSLILDIKDLQLNIKKNIFFSLLVKKFRGVVNVKTLLKRFKLQIRFLKNFDTYYLKPKVYCVVQEMNIDDNSLSINSDIENLPSGFVDVIAYIFRTQIKDSIEFYVKNTMHRDTTQQINALIQRFYRDSIDIDDNMAINVLMTDQIIVEEGQIQLRIAGEFFRTDKPYIIQENQEDIIGFDKDNLGIQFGLSQLALSSFMNVFFSNPKNYFMSTEIQGVKMNSRISFDKTIFNIGNYGILIQGVKLGVFCDSPDDWACMEIMTVDLGFKLQLFDPICGIIYLQDLIAQITKSQLVNTLGGSYKEAIYKIIVNEFLKALPLDVIKIMPLPIPDFLHLNNLLFTHYNGFAFMETTFELTDIRFI